MFSPDTPTSPTFPYRIEAEIGSGAMGIVYRAIEIGLERPVAIKVLRMGLLQGEAPDVEREARERFLREARAAAALSHPGVTIIYRVGEEGGVPFIAMEWLPGRTLEAVLEQHGRLELGEAARLTVELLEALEVAHRRGVVHRDVKPANLVLLDDGRLKVTDFGIARLEGSDLAKTQAGVVLATPRFASPEQLAGSPVDGRSDLFSTGVLLYLLITGKLPFGGKTFMELATAIVQSQPVPVRQLVAQLPAGIQAVLDRALAKDPAQRFQSAAEMAEQLRAFATGRGALETGRGEPVAQGEPRDGETWPTRPSLIHHGLPRDLRLAIVRFVESWPPSKLPRQVTRPLLDRLVDKPLHAPAFSGAAVLGRVCLLLHEGRILAAVDTSTGESSELVAESIDSETTPILYPLPPPLTPSLMPLLATVFRPAKVRHADLHSSFVNLPALASKLRSERFSGLIRLHLESSTGLVFFDQGTTALSLFSEGWTQVPIAQGWETWVSDVNVQASVEERNEQPVGLWYRRVLRGFELKIEPAGDDGAAQKRQLPSGSRGATARTGQTLLQVAPPPGEIAAGSAGSAGMGYVHDPAYRFLDWMIRSLPAYFAERDKLARWKYLAEWVLLVRRAVLHHDLPRPGARDTDFFDLVTFDDQDKVLHLGQRVARATPECLKDFTDRAVEAKLARKKTGDVGGAFLVAPTFEPATLEAYDKAVNTSSGSWFGLEESFTGYEGFLRVGPRRGFHLLLVEEREGDYVPVLPA